MLSWLPGHKPIICEYPVVWLCDSEPWRAAVGGRRLALGSAITTGYINARNELKACCKAALRPCGQHAAIGGTLV
jgi:hypothetical protein